MTRKPAITHSVPALQCSPRCATGISTTTTPYTMAPAENARIHSMYGEMSPDNHNTTRTENS